MAVIETENVLTELLRQDLAAFSQRALRTLSPGSEYQDNWHIRAMCHALAKVADGQIRRLLITVPPRHLKSHVASVCFPAWLLARDPTKRFICVSYSSDLAETFSMSTRTIVNQSWYKEMAQGMSFDPKRMTKDQLWTTKLGYRLATSVGGTLTGKGGDFLILDDPTKAEDGLSESARKATISWFKNTLSSRFENPKTVAIVVIAQRLHVDDLPGHLIEEGGWHHLNLPAEAWEHQQIDIAPGKFFFRKPGDLLFPQRFGPEELDSARKALGTASYEAQFNQRPTPAGGHMLHLKWFKTFELPLKPSLIEAVYQSWDTALETGDTNDYSVCTTWAVSGRKLYLLDVFRERLPFYALEKKVVELKNKFKAKAVIVEKAGSGISLFQNLRGMKGCQWVLSMPPHKDKVCRAAQQTPKLENGTVYLPANAPWRPAFDAEVTSFPFGKHDDQIDSVMQFLLTLDYGRGHASFHDLSMYAG
jgi:predicted phage terminase large subunit-like protein